MELLNITSKVLGDLREKIIVGDLKPGYKLNELDISMKLGVSRPPLREAFRILETDNMVVNIPRKGTYVTELSLKDFLEVSQTREMIECYSVDLLKASDIRKLPLVEAAIEKARSLFSPSLSVDQWVTIENIRAVLDFHVGLVQSTGNAILLRIHNSISHTLARYQNIYFHIDDSIQHSLEAHKKVLELLGEGDFERAKEELRTHVNFAVELIKTRIVHRAVF
jgi:DNA-binding GntR family transcriptional regulator